jgi:mannosyltransferase OCH1-like enzyme
MTTFAKVIPSKYTVIQPKYIVIHNTLDRKIEFVDTSKTPNTHGVVDAHSNLFNNYFTKCQLKIHIHNHERIAVKAIGFVICITIYEGDGHQRRKWDDFYMACGGIYAFYQSDPMQNIYIGANLQEMNIQNISIIDTLRVHFMINNPDSKPYENVPLIPKILHFIWLKKEATSVFNTGYINTWLEFQKGYQCNVWTDFPEDEVPEEMRCDCRITMKYDNDITEVLGWFETEHPNTSASSVYRKTSQVGARSDILRYMLIYKYGGMYADINDFECFKSTDELFHKYSFIIGAETSFADNKDFVFVNNALIAGMPGHEVLRRMLYLITMTDRIKDGASWKDIDDYVANVTGVALLRAVVLGYFMDPSVDKKDSIILPSVYIYPACFYDAATNIHIVNSKDDKDKWLHSETYAAHYTQHAFVDMCKLPDLPKNVGYVRSIYD